ncbi:hypothetical protein HYALB_00011587 [Hymenoscyphus albidus]|uniref:2EXR domain-containing protein n=1 Tax=Hymenoscyphus albidus TaxID=595503 RepID=A0A9N9LWL1_9HELO|nr:hypothetical protein HYALB_00011587 [Hymenoscyphus albidus]
MTKEEDITRSAIAEAVGNDETIRSTKREREPRPQSLPPPPLTITRAQKRISTIFKKPPPRFPRFMDLPAEIRMQIWEESFEYRVHELHPCAKLYNDRMTFRSNSSQTPAIFHVNRESRAIALKNYQLMKFDPVRGNTGKGILRFYFHPERDTLLLNSLMGLFMMFVLLEEEADYAGTMKGWQTVAFDAERAQLITLLSGIHGHAPQPRIKEVFPSLQKLIIAFDYTSRGKTRFRTSVWPGENGTSLKKFPWPVMESTEFDNIFNPMREYLENDFEKGSVPEIHVAKVKRKAFIRGDIRYAFRKSCAFVGVRPRGIFRRI